ncbi:MAG: riboflavin synthase [Armatimonadota bacterium]|nr:riboflavin synthase [Armatimonadota bacterium]
MILFTGLIELVGTVRSLRRAGSSARITVDLGAVASELKLGESVAINGVCLTVISAGGTEASFDMVAETLERSSLSRLSPGDRVNIERALRPGDRLGGHFVQGHVDALGKISRINRNSGGVEIEITAPPEAMELIVEKGSIAVDGISLTVANRDKDKFAVAVIPHTLENTNLGSARPGTEVNLETDILGKYVRGFMKGHPQQEGDGVTENMLRDAGYI